MFITCPYKRCIFTFKISDHIQIFFATLATSNIRHKTSFFAIAKQSLAEILSHLSETLIFINYEALKTLIISPNPQTFGLSYKSITMSMFGVTPQTRAGVAMHLGTFSLFPRLPVEVRLLIWEETCRQGRLITVFTCQDPLEDEQSLGHGNIPFYTFKSRDPIPSILHATREARAVARKFYTLAFDTRKEFPSVTALDRTAGSIWVNPLYDIICPMSSITDSQCDALRAKIYDLKVQRIALNDCAFQRSSTMRCDRWGTFLSRSPPEWMNENIKEVTLYTTPCLLLPSDDIELVETNDRIQYPPSTLILKRGVMRRQNVFFGNLQRLQRLQLVEDEKNKRLGRNCNRIYDCPQWLYDCRKTWSRPQQRYMAARPVNSILF